MKLQARLGLTVAAAASVAIFLMATAFWVLAAREQRQSVDDFLVERVRDVRALEALPRGRRASSAQALDRVFDQGVALRFRFVRPDGTVVLDDGLPDVDPRRELEFDTIGIDGVRYRMATVKLGGANSEAVFQVARNIEDVEAALSRLRQRIVIGSILGIGLAGVLGVLIARRLSKPIAEVAAAAHQMALRQDLPTRIDVDRTDEVGDLANSFNQMLAALQVSREQQQRLVADASHELRTPLTSLRLKIDLLDSTPDLPRAQRQELLSSAALELERLTDLVAELVDLAADPNVGDEVPVPVELSRLVEDVAERIRRSSGRTIVVEADHVVARVRDRGVRRAISNLLDNAVKYSPAGSDITLTQRRGHVEVRDHGPGIPTDELDHVFDRFYRSPAARTQPGNGIGLAIVHRVAELHGGEVWARNAPDGGAIVGFSVTVDGDAPESVHPDRG